MQNAFRNLGYYNSHDYHAELDPTVFLNELAETALNGIVMLFVGSNRERPAWGILQDTISITLFVPECLLIANADPGIRLISKVRPLPTVEKPNQGACIHSS